MGAGGKKLPIRPVSLEWLGEALKLREVFSDKSALEQAMESFPAITLEVWPAGEEVLREGEFGDDFFVVYAGRLSVLRTGDEEPRRQRRVGVLKRGDFFGEIGFLMKSARSATVRTDLECRLFRIPAAELTVLLGKHKNFSRWVKKVACKRLVRLFEE